MSKNVSVGVTIGAVLGSSFRGAFSTADTRVKKLGEAIRQSSRRGSTGEEFKRASAALTQMQAQLSTTGTRLATLRRQMEVGPPTKKLAAEVSRAAKEYDRLYASTEKARTRVASSKTAHETAAAAAEKHSASLGKLGRSMEAVERKHKVMSERMRRRDELGQKLRDMRGRMLGVVGAVWSGKQWIDAATEVDTSLVKLSTVVNAKDVGAALAESRRSAFEFARHNLANESDILGIEYALNSAGFEAGLARAGAGIVTKVATVTDGVASSVGEIMATVYNNLGDSLTGTAEEKFARIGEILTKTQYKFQIRNFDQLGESMKMAYATLSSNNIDLDQGATLLGTLNTAGLQGGMAGTALTASIRNMSKASKEFGFEIARNGRGGMDVIATLERMSDKLGGFDNMDQKTIDRLQKVFGDEGMKAVALIGKQVKDLRAAEKDVRDNSKGIVDTSYQRFVESSAGQQKIFANNVRLVGIAFGGVLLPGVNAVLKPLTAAARWVGIAVEKYPAIAKIIGVVAVSLVAATAGMVAVTAAQWAWNAAMLANPITWVVGGVIAAGIAIFTLWSHWDSVTQWVQTTWRAAVDFIGSTFDSVVGWFRDAGIDIGTAISEWRPLQIITEMWDSVTSYLSSLPDRMFEAGAAIIGGLIKGVKSKAGALKDSVVSVGDNTIGWFKRKLRMNSPSRVFMDIGKGITEGLSIGVTQGENGPTNAMQGISKRIAGALTTGLLAVSGANMPAIAASMEALQIHKAAGAPAAQQVITINVTVNGTADGDEIAAKIREVLAEQGRDAALVRNGRPFD